MPLRARTQALAAALIAAGALIANDAEGAPSIACGNLEKGSRFVRLKNVGNAQVATSGSNELACLAFEEVSEKSPTRSTQRSATSTTPSDRPRNARGRSGQQAHLPAAELLAATRQQSAKTAQPTGSGKSAVTTDGKETAVNARAIPPKPPRQNPRQFVQLAALKNGDFVKASMDQLRREYDVLDELDAELIAEKHSINGDDWHVIFAFIRNANRVTEVCQRIRSKDGACLQATNTVF